MGADQSCCSSDKREDILPEVVAASAAPAAPAAPEPESEIGASQSEGHLGPIDTCSTHEEPWNPLKSLDLDHEVLHGIALHHILQRPCRPWLSRRRSDLFEQSQQVYSLDVFLSHCWQAPGLWKFMGLLLSTGWLHGLAGWFILMSSTLLLRFFDVLDAPFQATLGAYEVSWSPWSLVAGIVGLLLGLSLSPYLPLKRTFCFLDIACINQEVEDLRRRGIHNIGGFLSVSRELHVLYHPTNFKSLWCMFELAAFRKANPSGRITLTPLFLVRLVTLSYFCALLSVLVFPLLLSLLQDAEFRQRNLVWLWAASQFLPWFLLVHLARSNYQEKRQLLLDLRCFQLDKLSCESSFDKECIYAAIGEWYASQETFTAFVRGSLCDELLAMLPKPHIHASHAALLSTSGVSFLCEICASLYHAGADSAYFTRFMIGWSCQTLFSLPICFNLVFYVSDCLAGSRSCLVNVSKSVAGTACVVACNGVCVALTSIAISTEATWLCLSYSVIYLGLFLWTFSSRS